MRTDGQTWWSLYSFFAILQMRLKNFSFIHIHIYFTQNFDIPMKIYRYAEGIVSRQTKDWEPLIYLQNTLLTEAMYFTRSDTPYPFVLAWNDSPSGRHIDGKADTHTLMLRWPAVCAQIYCKYVDSSIARNTRLKWTRELFCIIVVRLFVNALHHS